MTSPTGDSIEPQRKPSMSGWHELRIEVVRDDAEPWSDALLEAGALSVQAEDADAESPDEQPLYGEPGMPAAGPEFVPGWRRTVLAALIDASVDAQSVLDAATEAIGRPAPPIAEIRFVADQDWVRLTQSQFEPIPIGERLVITPSWHASDDPAHIEIVLDPGLAFGTGSHPTTRLCLQWLERMLPAGATVIDYGCGSGILAIAAARLGAARVIGVDIDPQALVATRDNAQRNRVEVEIRASSDARPEPADVVVANILSSPLKLLAPMLTDLVKPGGLLVISGVLERQIDDVSAAYAPHLALDVAGLADGWACLAATKPR
jgi:ribosomal protein L11 methyltransferase